MKEDSEVRDDSALVVIHDHEDEDQAGADEHPAEPFADRIAAERRADERLVRETDGSRQGARPEDDLELLRLLELLLRITRAERDAGVGADLRFDHRRRVDLVVEDDGESSLDVGPGDLLEAVGPGRAEGDGDVELANAGAAAVVLADRRVGDVVARHFGAAVQVVCPPADGGRLAGVRVELVLLVEANLVVVRHAERRRPLLEADEAVGHRLVRLLRHPHPVRRHRLARSGGGVLDVHRRAFGEGVFLHLAEEVGLVVDHLELETGGLADRSP